MKLMLQKMDLVFPLMHIVYNSIPTNHMIQLKHVFVVCVGGKIIYHPAVLLISKFFKIGEATAVVFYNQTKERKRKLNFDECYSIVNARESV